MGEKKKNRRLGFMRCFECCLVVKWDKHNLDSKGDVCFFKEVKVSSERASRLKFFLILFLLTDFSWELRDLFSHSFPFLFSSDSFRSTLLNLQRHAFSFPALLLWKIGDWGCRGNRPGFDWGRQLHGARLEDGCSRLTMRHYWFPVLDNYCAQLTTTGCGKCA